MNHCIWHIFSVFRKLEPEFIWSRSSQEIVTFCNLRLNLKISSCMIERASLFVAHTERYVLSAWVAFWVLLTVFEVICFCIYQWIYLLSVNNGRCVVLVYANSCKVFRNVYLHETVNNQIWCPRNIVSSRSQYFINSYLLFTLITGPQDLQIERHSSDLTIFTYLHR